MRARAGAAPRREWRGGRTRTFWEEDAAAVAASGAAAAAREERRWPRLEGTPNCGALALAALLLGAATAVARRLTHAPAAAAGRGAAPARRGAQVRADTEECIESAMSAGLAHASRAWLWVAGGSCCAVLRPAGAGGVASARGSRIRQDVQTRRWFSRRGGRWTARRRAQSVPTSILHVLRREKAWFATWVVLQFLQVTGRSARRAHGGLIGRLRRARALLPLPGLARSQSRAAAGTAGAARAAQRIGDGVSVAAKTSKTLRQPWSRPPRPRGRRFWRRFWRALQPRPAAAAPRRGRPAAPAQRCRRCARHSSR
jgi:hypothetical protein